MVRHRANGGGNLRKRKDDHWEGRYTTDCDPGIGRAIYKNVLGKTQVEAKAKLKQAIGEARRLDMAEVGRYTVGQQTEVWFGHYIKIEVRPFSHQTYRGCAGNHIKPNTGKVPLGKFIPLELQKSYKKPLEQGRAGRPESRHQVKGLSPKAMWNTHQTISSTMDPAREQKLIAINPAEGYVLPQLEYKEMKTLLMEQLQSFLRGSKDSGVSELYYLELTTGLRRGEPLGPRQVDIDLERDDLWIQRQIVRTNDKVVGAPLKTKNVYHILLLAEDTIGVPRAQKRKTGDSSWVFPSPTGRSVSPDSALYMLHQVLKRVGLPRVRFHDLRYTFIALASQNGVDMKTVSGMLGYFSAGFTLSTYAHVTTIS